MSSSNSWLMPQVGGAPGGVPLTRQEPAQAPDARGAPAAETPAFDQVLKQLQQPTSGEALAPSVGPRVPLKFSAHANARLQSRKIDTGPEQMRKLGEAVDKAAAKGLDDTLILTPDAAFIVSVKNRTVITVMDREQLQGNVFTNIEGAVIA